jgi:hypothetical protein
MSILSSQRSAIELVRKILIADFACDDECFDREGIHFFIAKEIAGARRFPLPEKFLAAVSMGMGEIISCSADRFTWVKKNLPGLGIRQLFYSPALGRMNKYVSRDGQVMTGPYLEHICTKDTFQPFRIQGDNNIIFDLIMREGIGDLYPDSRFPNALDERNSPERPHMVAVVAHGGGGIIGMATACADTDDMWQIGVDTTSEYRRLGIGKAMVSLLTSTLFEMEKLPYYATSVANIPSRRIAAALGYRPAWVEAYSRNKVRL